MEAVKYAALIIFGLGSGVVVSAGVFSLIATVALIPRMAEKTNTENRIMLYEEAITLGGISGTLVMYVNFQIPVGHIIAALFSLCIGIFFGELAVSIAEVLNVFPIFVKRLKLRRCVSAIVVAFAFGKAAGSLMYFLIKGFYSMI